MIPISQAVSASDFKTVSQSGSTNWTGESFSANLEAAQKASQEQEQYSASKRETVNHESGGDQVNAAKQSSPDEDQAPEAVAATTDNANTPSTADAAVVPPPQPQQVQSPDTDREKLQKAADTDESAMHSLKHESGESALSQRLDRNLKQRFTSTEAATAQPTGTSTLSASDQLLSAVSVNTAQAPSMALNSQQMTVPVRKVTGKAGQSIPRASNLNPPVLNKDQTSRRQSAVQDLTDPDAFMKHLNQSLAVAGQIDTRPQGLVNASDSTQKADTAAVSTFASPAFALPNASSAGQNISNAATQFYKVDVPLNSEGWGKAMSQQVIAFMKNQTSGEHIAQMRLDPPELGPLHVRLRIDEAGMAQAIFSSANAQVRQVLEQALPDLQRNMNAAGLSLAHADIDDRSAQADHRDGQASSHGQSRQGVAQTVISDDLLGSTTTKLPVRHEGIVSTFA